MTEDPEIDLRDIIDARNNSENRAGLVEMSDKVGSGGKREKEVIVTKHFDNEEECECECHPNKPECMDCYQHPIHLSKKHKK